MSTPTVTLTARQWKSFCKVLTGLARACNDVDINEGMIRQCSNDRDAIFEVDLRPLVGGAAFTIPYFKEKLKPLKSFKSGVTITLGQNQAVFSDGDSPYTILVPDRNNLDNKFMSQQEIESWLPAGYREMPPLIRNRIGEKILKRIRTFLSKVHADTYKVIFVKHSASLRVERKAEGPREPGYYMEFIRDIPLFQPTTGHGQLPSLPFKSLDWEKDIVWEVCRREKTILIRNYGEIGAVKATIYLAGEMIDNPPGPESQAKRQSG
ncbi:MAG: hypothetical protein FJ123_00035 [Deltaproteobacteria bacterium]|nr:hypothetical protein [Deltaproteobacteria bacterium]